MNRKVPIALALVLAAGAYFVIDVRQRARLDRGTKYHRTDLTVYQYASRALVRGEDPYEARNPRGYRYVYPPLLALLLMPIADWRPPQAALVFFVVSLACLLAALRVLRGLPLGPTGRLGWPAVLLGLVVCLGFAHQGFQRGQVTHVLLALQVCAFACLLRGRLGLAGFALAIAGVLRLTPLLPAAAVGLGLLAAALQGRGWHRPLRYGGGLLAGLALGFVVLPVVALGADRARAVSARWLEVTQEVYADNADLMEDYRINEWRFKNQAPRRVMGTWAGWLSGAGFAGERPQLDDATRAVVDGAAKGTSLALLLLALVLGACFLRDPAHPRYALVFAATLLLPVLMTRYAWPTHYVMGLPAVAVAAGYGRGRARTAVVVLLAGTLLFYAAHARALQPLGAAGVLMVACVAFLTLLLVDRRCETGAGRGLHAYLRRRLGGLRELAAFFPGRGRIVDLGCGVGLLAHALVEDHPERRVHAVDHDPQRIVALVRSAAGRRIDVVFGDLARVHVPACAGVALVDVLHYLDGPEQEAVVARAAQALEPGGVLLLRDPDPSAPLRYGLARLHEALAVGTGFTRGRRGRYRRGAEWRDLLAAHGLHAEVRPLRRFWPYADRTVIGRKP